MQLLPFDFMRWRSIPSNAVHSLPLRTDIFVNLGAAPLRVSRVRVLTFCNQRRIARSSTPCSEQKTRTLETRKGAAPNFTPQIK
jgi:hypothetical protein